MVATLKIKSIIQTLKTYMLSRKPYTNIDVGMLQQTLSEIKPCLDMLPVNNGAYVKVDSYF